MEEKENVQGEDLELEEETSQETDESGADETTKAKDSQADAKSEREKELEVQLAAEKKKNEELFGRTKRAEKKIDKPKSNPEQVDQVDLAEFFSKGGTKQDYEQLQVIMRGKGLSMAEAQKDPLFEAYIEREKAKKRDEAAQVNTRRIAADTTKIKPEMSREEHQKIWKEKNAQ